MPLSVENSKIFLTIKNFGKNGVDLRKLEISDIFKQWKA